MGRDFYNQKSYINDVDGSLIKFRGKTNRKRNKLLINIETINIKIPKSITSPFHRFDGLYFQITLARFKPHFDRSPRIYLHKFVGFSYFVCTDRQL